MCAMATTPHSARLPLLTAGATAGEDPARFRADDAGGRILRPCSYRRRPERFPARVDGLRPPCGAVTLYNTLKRGDDKAKRRGLRQLPVELERWGAGGMMNDER